MVNRPHETVPPAVHTATHGVEGADVRHDAVYRELKSTVRSACTIVAERVARASREKGRG